ncbi:MAG: alginate export family protein [Gammaproteobacteria bacterium]|nr:alginate export family protein [Gammaproteobacteria bacterium]
MSPRYLLLCTTILSTTALSTTLMSSSIHAQSAQPWRLIDSTEQTRVQFNHLLRLESLDGQFRAGRQGSSDQVLLSRTIMTAEFRRDNLALGLEVLDVRQALADSGSSLSSGIVNTAALQQLYVSARGSDFVQQGSALDVKLGRQSVDIASRRLMSRSGYNTAPVSFTGVTSDFRLSDGKRLQAFYLLPMQNLPGDLPSLLDNRTERDRESETVKLWGMFAELPALTEWLRGDFYYIRLNEKDTRAQPGTNRRINTFGTRLFRPAALQQFDFEVEGVSQRGSSHATAAVTDVRELDHRAYLFHAEVGYTFDSAWRPRLQLQFDHASGDEDPTDGRNGRFDTLYGDRRFDFGPTSIYGPFSRSNLVSLGYRVTATPKTGVRLMLAHREFRLAESRDQWVGTGLRDASGRSGRGLGQQLEARVQWDAVPGNLMVESGIALIAASGFARRLPGSDIPSTTRYFYLQSVLSF